MGAHIEMQRRGARVYAFGDTYAAKSDLRALGCHWDPEARGWWVGAAKAPELEALVARVVSAPAAEPAARAPQDPSDIRLTGKGVYKGRTYYVGATTRDGSRMRLLTLPKPDGTFLDFWADAASVQITKTYEPRDVWDGRMYSGRTVRRYTTLGSIAQFIRDRQAGVQDSLGCPECGSTRCTKAWNPRALCDED